MWWEKDLDAKIHKLFPERTALFGKVYHKDGDKLYVAIEVTPEEETFLALTFGAEKPAAEVITQYMEPYMSEVMFTYVKE